MLVVAGSLFAQNRAPANLGIQLNVVPGVQLPVSVQKAEFSIPIRRAAAEVRLIRTESPQSVIETTVVVPE